MSNLFDPLQFRCGKTAPNRIAMAPMTNYQSNPDGSLSEAELTWLRSRAQGGFGTIITCAANVSADGAGWPCALGIHSDALVSGLSVAAQSIREKGPLAITQIAHCGPRSPADLIGQQPWSASDDPKSGARAGTTEEIHRVIGDFADAAARAEAAGMDGVEIHGAHGYLLTEFLSHVKNQRRDEWGGSFENRARLVRQITQAVRARVAPGFIVGMRLSPEDGRAVVGLDLDETLQLAEWLAQDGIDYLHLSLWEWQRLSQKRPDEHIITQVRAALPAEVRVMAAGKIWTPAEAQAVLDLGADAVALGRAAIVNPDWARRARDPAFMPRRPPLTPAEFRAIGLSDQFIDSLRPRPDFVGED